MKNKKELIITKGLDVAHECAQKLELEIISVDYVFENGIKIFRVIASSKNGLTIDEASLLNQSISEKLDELDFIDEEYYLEVSSEGIEKELRNENDIIENIGKYIFIKLYEKVDGIKEVYGDLIKYENNLLTIQYNVKGRNKVLEVKKDQISKIRLAIKF